jgi:aspartate dehydrogenase
MDRLSAEHDPVVAAVLVRAEKISGSGAAMPLGTMAISRVGDIPADVDLVVETAGHAAVVEFAEIALRSGRDFLMVSSGALGDRSVEDRLRRAVRESGRRLLVASGAIGALDAVQAAAAAGPVDIRYIGIKPPAAWKGTHAETVLNLSDLREPTAFFRGSARDVVGLYPKNTNVAATVALAGCGFDRTAVELIADPAGGRNIHRLEIRSALADASFEIEAKALPSNPKTSAITAFSVLNFLRTGGSAIAVAGA